MTDKEQLKEKWEYDRGFSGNKYDNVYYWGFDCCNCYKRINIVIKKGIKIKDLKIKCNNCGIENIK